MRLHVALWIALLAHRGFLVHTPRCGDHAITLLEDRWTEAKATAMMDSDNIARRIFVVRRGGGLVFALLAGALTR